MAGKKSQKAGWTRRDFFNWTLNLVMGVITILVAIPAVGAAVSPAFHKAAPVWVNLGAQLGLQQSSIQAGSGGVGTVVKAPYSYVEVDHWAKFPASDYAYLRYIGGACAFYILSPICTHLGCHVNWIQADNQFYCPCHGSVYTVDGLNVSGPAPLPLGVFRWKVVANAVWVARESTFTHAHQRSAKAPKEPCLKEA